MNLDYKNQNKCSISKYSFVTKFNISRFSYFWKAIDFIACKIKRFAKVYENSISKEYKKEGNLFNISESKNTLHIGCGAYPVTAITLAKLNGGRVVGIDIDKRAIKMATDIINKKNLQDKITIQMGDGRNYPLKEFDTIIISSCSIPKIEILTHIFKTARNNCKIIVREIYGASKSVEDCINLHDNIEIINRIGNHPFPTSRWESFCLIKNS
jgi:2-polyprenyl-3-methyl-5-hydroxy-6-metoxy-1,4-benzoquinol methylase